MKTCIPILLSFLILSYLSSPLKAQQEEERLSIEKEFATAKDFLISFKNDSALLILDILVEVLSTSDRLNTPIGLQIQYHQAEALEKDHQDETAIQKLLQLVETSASLKQWDVFCNAHLSLARLYEKIGDAQNCLSSLRQTQAAIEQHAVDSLYPRFAIRISSYHRIYDDRDSSVFYANEVLRTAPVFGQHEHEAVGHMLMGMLTSNTAYEKAAGHYKAAGKTFLEVEDFSGYSYIQSNLTRLHFRNNKPRLALAYNDSTITAAQRSVAMGNDNRSALPGAYRFRAEIFRSLGQHDSAWHYLNKGYEMEVAYVKKRNLEKVIEIDARYRDEKKAQKIAEQAQLLEYERDRRNLLIGILSLSLLFAMAVTYYYLKLRNAKRQTESQALVISKKNNDLSKSLDRQLMLQSEVHHRVKNNLQVIISLLDLQREEIDDLKAVNSLETMSKRIYSMAAIHEILYNQEDMAQVNLYDYTENLCAHFSNLSKAGHKPEFDIEINNLFFNLETSMPLGIILTELLTNSLKYAGIEGQTFKIHIGLKSYEDGYCLSYSDNGPGFPEGELEEREGGLGSYLLKSMSRQLNGHLESKNDSGASYRIFFKAKHNPALANP